ncbi:MAG: hypothetical protein AAFV27_10125, partial [Pseudomonadota bacterium]
MRGPTMHALPILTFTCIAALIIAVGEVLGLPILVEALAVVAAGLIWTMFAPKREAPPAAPPTTTE